MQCAQTKACAPCKRHWHAPRLSAWSQPRPPAGQQGCSSNCSSPTVLLVMQVASKLRHRCCGFSPPLIEPGGAAACQQPGKSGILHAVGA